MAAAFLAGGADGSAVGRGSLAGETGSAAGSSDAAQPSRPPAEGEAEDDETAKEEGVNWWLSLIVP